MTYSLTEGKAVGRRVYSRSIWTAEVLPLLRGQLLERLEEMTRWVEEFGEDAARKYGVDETIRTVKEDLTRAQRNIEALEKKCLGLKIVE